MMWCFHLFGCCSGYVSVNPSLDHPLGMMVATLHTYLPMRPNGYRSAGSDQVSRDVKYRLSIARNVQTGGLGYHLESVLDHNPSKWRRFDPV